MALYKNPARQPYIGKSRLITLKDPLDDSARGRVQFLNNWGSVEDVLDIDAPTRCILGG